MKETLTVAIKVQSEEASKSLNELQDNLKEVKETTKKASKETSVFADVLKADLVSKGISAAISGMKSLIKMGVDFNAQMEQYTVAFKGITGSAEEAEAILAQIKEDAKSTPFDVNSLAEGTQLLMSTGESAEDSRKAILALGDAIAYSGKGQPEFERMLQNLQQIKNAGVATAQDMKQFSSAGVNMYKLLADANHITVEEASQTKWSYEQITAALEEANSEGGVYYNAMTAQSQTFNGQMSNLKDTLQQAAGDLMENLMPTISKVVDIISTLVENGWLEKIAIAVGVITTAILAYKAATLASNIITNAATVAQTAWNLALSLNPIGLVVAAIAALVAAVVVLWNKCDWFREGILKIWEGIKSYISFVIDFWSGIVNKIKDGIATIHNFFKEKIDGIKNFFTGLRDTVKGVVDKIKSFFQFKVELPQIKLPHFAIKPEGWQIGDLLKGKIPSLGINWYAKGGVFDEPTLFGYNGGLSGLGENGAEAVVPLENNLEWLDKLADKLGDKLSLGNTPIVLNVDGKTFAQTSISTINDLTRQTGSLGLNLY